MFLNIHVMKQTFFQLVLLLAIGTAAHAQSGQLFIQGNFGQQYNSPAISNNSLVFWGDYRDVQVNPMIGYQFSKHSAIGIQGGLRAMHYNSNVDNNFKQWNAGLFYRYTQQLGNVFFVYGQAGLGYSSNKLRDDNVNINSNSITLSLFPGIGAYIYKGWAIHANIGGIAIANSNASTTSINTPFLTTIQNGLYSNLGDQVGIGISKTFSFKKKVVKPTE